MIDTLTKAAASLVSVFILASCASISVVDGTEHATAGLKMPEIIYVESFRTAQGEFNVDRTGPELADFKKNLQLMLRTGIVKDLSDKLAPAAEESRSDRHWIKNAWLIRGEFTTVNQGSRLLRGAVGFGAGGTKLETKVEVYDLSGNGATPFLTFSTTGGSNAEPGAIMALSTDPLLLVINGVSGVAHGLSEDTARTSRMITAQLSDYMYRHGLISREQWIEPKKPGNGDMW